MASLHEADIGGRGVSGSDGFGQYLNPEAMLTPGVAGAMVMMITNSLASNFDLSRAYTGLCLSFVCGLLVLVIDRQWWMRAVYYVLNSLIIFCVAFGANGLGAGVAGSSMSRLSLAPISVALAEPMGARNGNAAGAEQPAASSPSQTQLEETIRQQQATIEQLRKANEANRPAAGQRNTFFAPWTLK